MDSDQEMSIEKRLAQTMIDLNKGHLYVNIHQRRDDLMKAIHIIKQKIEFYAKQNYILNEFKGKAELVNNKINEMSEIDVQKIFDEIGKQNDTKEVSIQTERVAPRSTFHGKATKYKDSIQLAYNLSSKEKLLRKKLNDIKLATNYRGPNYLLVKISEYEDLKSKAVDFTEGNEFDAHSGITSLYNEHHHEHHHEHHSISDDSAFAPNDLVTPLSIETQSQPNPETVLSTSTCVGSSSISNSGGVFEESDDEGVQLLLSMKRNVFSCKCGEYLNSITDWSEHQKICSRSTDKTIGEQCQLCKKTFLTCVALNIHSTKKHNKKKMRTDSIMHCPCGQSFTAKWRQNCVHKLNSHGRHCKAFKAREIQCSICKKGFIERKSLEYHGLKAHKLAVPVNS